MKQLWPIFAIIVGIVALGAVLGKTSCSKPDVQLISTGVAKTNGNGDVATAVIHAQRTLDSFVAEYEHPKPGDRGFGIQGSFPTPSGPEHIWVHLTSYKNGVFTGHLADEPTAATSIHKGDKVSVKSADVSDWIYEKDGKKVGGFTIDALGK